MKRQTQNVIFGTDIHYRGSIAIIRKKLIAILALIIITPLVYAVPSAGAQVAEGKVCKKKGKKGTDGEMLFTCLKKGKKLTWGQGTFIEYVDLNVTNTNLNNGMGIQYSIEATVGDRCQVTVSSSSGPLKFESFDFKSQATFVSRVVFYATGSYRLEADCDFSGSDLEYLTLTTKTNSPSSNTSVAPSPQKTASASPRPSSTISTAPSPKTTPTPSPSATNPFADAATAAAKEAEAKKQAELERARLLEEEKEKTRQKSIANALAQLKVNFCGNRANCEVGKTGPGGGLIIFHAWSPQWWGTYLEVRVTNLQTSWCDKPTLALSKNVTDKNLLKTIGGDLGHGKGNTQLMLAACTSGAANVVNQFRGGGLDDWYLPSTKELDQICKFAAGENIEEVHVCHRSPNSTNLWSYFPSIGEYWSSTEYLGTQPEGNFARYIRFYDGKTGPLDKKAIRDVLAIRAFGPKG